MDDAYFEACMPRPTAQRRTRVSHHCGHLIEQYGYDDAGPAVYIDGELREMFGCVEQAKAWCEENEIDVTERETMEVEDD